MRCQAAQSGVILHSGAIGDCVLTLPLAAYVKKVHGLQWLDFIGPAEYIEFYPGRTCINAVSSIEGLDLHHLFEDPRQFEAAEYDRLAGALARYEHIISFIGAGYPSFERNLLFAVHSTHTAEVTVIPARPPADRTQHVTDYYLDVFRREQQIEQADAAEPAVITPLSEDYLVGADLLQQAAVNPEQTVIVIQPGSGSREKCWHWKNFIETAAALQTRHLQPVFLLGPAEQERFADDTLRAVRQYPVLENLSLTQVLQVLTQADACLGNDSGIAHIAAAMSKKTLVLFGPGNPARYAPRGPNVHIESLPVDRFDAVCADTCGRVLQTLLEML